MVGDGVHSLGERQDMASHEENHEQQLADFEGLPANSTEENFTGIGHAVDMGVTGFELAESVARVPSDG